jgi:hypothetical protein
MNYYTKLILCICLFFICFIILSFVSTKEGLVTFDNYSFDKYYGNYRKDYGYNNDIYHYPVFFDKNYKNFNDNSINYDTVYDAKYKHIL